MKPPKSRQRDGLVLLDESAARQMLISIYGTWHNCGLRKAERGMRKGRLCDSCIGAIEQHATQLVEAGRKLAGLR